MTAPRPTQVELGVIGKARGLRGDVWFRAFNIDGSALREDAQVQITTRAGVSHRMVVTSVKRAGDGIVAHFEGTDTREAAEALVGAVVSIERSALPPLGEGEYYHCDLPGMRVVTRSGTTLGEVLRVEAYPTIDALVVQTEQGEMELPMNADVVQSLDLVARVVVVDLSPLEE